MKTQNIIVRGLITLTLLTMVFSSGFGIQAQTTPENPDLKNMVKELLAFRPSAEIEWDDADSHKWIGAGWRADEPSSLNWGHFYGRDCLEIRWDYPAWLGYIYSDSFPDEDWEAPIF